MANWTASLVQNSVGNLATNSILLAKNVCIICLFKVKILFVVFFVKIFYALCPQGEESNPGLLSTFIIIASLRFLQNIDYNFIVFKFRKCFVLKLSQWLF